MRLGFFTMPLHGMDRDWAQTLKEDRETVILADRLGFHDAFIGEHLTDRSERVTNSMMFLASLVSDTKTIRLATGTSNLSQSHPVLIASQAAMLDHLAEGRFIFGVSPGALASDAEALGLLEEDRNRMFAEAIDVILEIWKRDPPYDIDLPGNRWKVSTRRTSAPHLGVGELPKPFQKPRPEIVGTVLAPFSKGVVDMGKRDFHPLSANFLLSNWLPTHWQNYAEGKAAVGEVADPRDWRVARTIFVADDEKTAERYGRTDPRSPYLAYYRQILAKLERSRRLFVMKESRDQPDEAVTLDHVMDRLVIFGTVNSVVDQILALREEAGAFGEIVYAGMDWVDPALTKRSMQLMAEEVMPRVNAVIAAGARSSAA
ncbi:LLM class flavin-dependent oxidoreductase [Falsiroseomonas sp. HW251]|uniref:LLM class flavin-dependent oxidoreductase n=1 Tax=Falsiroseomonas sp. HW251 TaxID=3390998 RepID=UPI003D316360